MFYPVSWHNQKGNGLAFGPMANSSLSFQFRAETLWLGKKLYRLYDLLFEG